MELASFHIGWERAMRFAVVEDVGFHCGVLFVALIARVDFVPTRHEVA